jgi:hypothetical protein
LRLIETDIGRRGAEERGAVRQDRRQRIIDDLEPWLGPKLALISQKIKLAEVMTLTARPIAFLNHDYPHSGS